MLIGEGNVGKTSLVRYFREGKPTRKEKEKKLENIATDGIDVQEIPYDK
jgi:GTPase SAR1 family protein